MSESFSVKLVSITQSEIFVDGQRLTPEQHIVYTARVSNPDNQENLESSEKLLRYLLKNKHFSPLEQVDFGVEIETSRFISAQILRHWSLCAQEWSQRYQRVGGYVEYPARRQDVKNRQNSIDDCSEETRDWFKSAQQQVWQATYSLYSEALSRGIAKELVRSLLPLNSKTKLYIKGNLRDWVFYLKTRLHKSTQLEHREIANSILDTVIVPNFPIIGSIIPSLIDE